MSFSRISAFNLEAISGQVRDILFGKKFKNESKVDYIKLFSGADIFFFYMITHTIYIYIYELIECLYEKKMRTATPIYILVDLFKIFIKSSCHGISRKEGAG